MVDPIWILAALLGAAFLVPAVQRLGGRAAALLFIGALAFAAAVPLSWFAAFASGRAEETYIFTAGFRPPISIALKMGLEESGVVAATGIAALLIGIYMLRDLSAAGNRAYVSFLLLVLGAAGLVMTRDIFNLFVFIEITGIASYPLIALRLDSKSLSAALKYALAGGVAAVFLLLGVIFAYRQAGTLDIDGIASFASSAGSSKIFLFAGFMVIFALLVEMKQFPANGWALDVYEAAPPGISAMISAGVTGGVLFAVYKVLPVAGGEWYRVAAIGGALTFTVSNVMALKQKSVTRMLGYSSVGQTGLLLCVIGLGGISSIGTGPYSAALIALFLNHFIAKAGLFGLAGVVGRGSIEDWKGVGLSPLRLVLMGAFVFALIGLPPFPGFWGKWSLVTELAGSGMFTWIAVVLLGSLLEAVYLLRWLGYAAGRDVTAAPEAEPRGFEEDEGEKAAGLPRKAESPRTAYSLKGAAANAPERGVVIVILGLLLFAAGYFASSYYLPGMRFYYYPIAASVVLFLLGRVPDWFKGLISLAVVAGLGYIAVPGLDGLPMFFSILFAAGGFVLLIASLSRKGYSWGFHPLAVLMIGSLVSVAAARGILEFFAAWELMTVSSYLLILRGRRAGKPALSYAAFSFGGGFLVLAGLAMAEAAGSLLPAAGAQGAYSLAAWPAAAVALSVAGFLIKSAVIGLHIWAPGSYAEAEDETTPILSGILSKSGILGLALVLPFFTGHGAASGIILEIIGWLGVLTAFFATLYACFQEDMKRLLAWSSIGQVGYIVLGLSAMTHLGWTAALWHTVNHLLFKGLLFLAVAGVIRRTGTRLMYRTGGLIKRMPLSFISVLIGIIALSGVPPLTGFAGKWLIYEALIEKGWYFQTGVAFMASTVAFLYCFRLIHSVFLGQPKPRFSRVREAPFWTLLPQYILIMLIMLFSVFPGRLIKPLSRIVDPVFPSTIRWEGFTAFTSLGYFNGTAVMLIVGAVFAAVLLFKLIRGPRPMHVEQFNIVFAAERPLAPETTHYAYDFFMPYRRAMAPVLKPLVKDFWNAVAEWAHTAGAVIRHIYSGDVQTYVIHIFIYGVILFILLGGVS